MISRHETHNRHPWAQTQLSSEDPTLSLLMLTESDRTFSPWHDPMQVERTPIKMSSPMAKWGEVRTARVLVEQPQMTWLNKRSTHNIEFLAPFFCQKFIANFAVEIPKVNRSPRAFV